LLAVVVVVVSYQKCLRANKHYGQVYAKAAFGEQALADAVAAIITKVSQMQCIGLAHYACVLAVANTMFAVEQHLKSGHGTMYFLSLAQVPQVKALDIAPTAS
jgi:hypothetical protein